LLANIELFPFAQTSHGPLASIFNGRRKSPGWPGVRDLLLKRSVKLVGNTLPGSSKVTWRLTSTPSIAGGSCNACGDGCATDGLSVFSGAFSRLVTPWPGRDAQRSVPQGDVPSPLLSNIMLHEFDAWLEAKYLSRKAPQASLGNFRIQQGRPTTVLDKRKWKPAVTEVLSSDAGLLPSQHPEPQNPQHGNPSRFSQSLNRC